MPCVQLLKIVSEAIMIVTRDRLQEKIPRVNCQVSPYDLMAFYGKDIN